MAVAATAQRRFTSKPRVDPGAVRELASDHPAMVENRTLFPSTVVTVTASNPERLLVSGHSNRKLGASVEKGAFKGWALYQLSLEERATCPADCDVRAVCYGNSMHMARRHRIGDSDIFFARLEEEIRALAAQHVGVLIRLHVLGDFPSLEYVAFWLDILTELPNVACYGYTHRMPSWLEGDEIGDAIERLKEDFGERFRIRWSFGVAIPDGAVVVTERPDGDRIVEDETVGTVCPAQTDATACCASCAFCWSTKDNAVVFLKHGPKEGPRDIAPPTEIGETRAIAPVKLDKEVKTFPVGEPPETRLVNPADLRVEAAYQRNLTAKSKKLIARIVSEWDWRKFKPPICADTDAGLFVIDGQHTAIAALTHGRIPLIPIIVTSGDSIARRASAFVAHNRDRVAMTPFDIFHAEVAARDPRALGVAAILKETGCEIPRSQPLRSYAKPGQVAAVNEVLAMHSGAGPQMLRRVLSVAASAGLSPITTRPLRALRRLFEKPDSYPWAATVGDDAIASAMRSIPGIDEAARIHAAKSGMDVQRACIALIKTALDRRDA